VEHPVRATGWPRWVNPRATATFLAQPHLVLLLLVVLYVMTVQPGHDWGDDFAMYIAHARNIASGQPYASTGYIYNPLFPDIGPRLYPPVFPLMLAPVYKAFGLSLTAMKLEVVAAFALALLVMQRLFSRHGSSVMATLTIAVVGLNPYLWDFRNQVLSDLPFLCFAFGALLLMDVLVDEAWRGRWTLAGALLLGGCVYGAYGTRVLGLVLVPALATYEMSTRRRIPWLTLAATGVFAVALLVQGTLLPNDSTYFDQIGTDPREWIRAWQANVSAYVSATGAFWATTPMNLPMRLLVGAIAALAGIGAWTEVRNSVRVWAVFALFYLLGVAAWPSFGGPRLLIPLLPLFVYYALLGAGSVGRRWQIARGQVAIAALLGMIAVLYGLAYTNLRLQPPQPEALGIQDVAAQELFTFIRTQTTPDSVVVFRKPRALALFTDRSSAVFPRLGAPQDVWPYILQIHAQYLVIGLGALDEPLPDVIAQHGQEVDQVFRNQQFTVYRLKNVVS
jgi:4-amino-4-deoxy-L-arabinose transferase-like glycosyltransferase